MNNRKTKKYDLLSKYGFTLIEMLVALGIFSLVIVVASGASVNLFGLFSKTQTIQSAVDNFNFAMESMTRDIRFGTDWEVRPENNMIVVWFEEEDTFISYALKSGRLIRTNALGGSYVTSENIKISDFKISSSGSDPNDLYHPIVTILVRGTFEQGKESTEFSVQTTVSQRDNE